MTTIFAFLAVALTLGCSMTDSDAPSRETKVGAVRQRLSCDCTIEGTCYEEGALNPSNSCLACRASISDAAWSRLDALECQAGLSAEYFNNVTLSGPPALTRIDAPLHLETWESPGAPIGEDNFSARWTGQLSADITDTYTFIAEADDAARLWINGKLIANTWDANQTDGKIFLEAGVRYDVQAEFYETTERALMRLSWYTDSGTVTWQTVPSENLYAAALTCTGCSDGNACTQDACTITGQCAHPAMDDGLVCPGGVCQQGSCCTGCDDGDPCTQDLCLEGGGCGHPPVDDGSACSGGSCQAGICCPSGDSTCLAGLSSRTTNGLKAA